MQFMDLLGVEGNHWKNYSLGKCIISSYISQLKIKILSFLTGFSTPDFDISICPIGSE